MHIVVVDVVVLLVVVDVVVVFAVIVVVVPDTVVVVLDGVTVIGSAPEQLLVVVSHARMLYDPGLSRPRLYETEPMPLANVLSVIVIPSVIVFAVADAMSVPPWTTVLLCTVNVPLPDPLHGTLITAPNAPPPTDVTVIVAIFE